MRGDQSTSTLETLRKLTQALRDPNPPAKLVPFLNAINQITDGKLRLADDVRYIYVVPQELNTEARVKSMNDKGYGIEFIPLTREDAAAMYQAVLDYSEHFRPAKEAEPVRSSAFRSKNRI